MIAGRDCGDLGYDLGYLRHGSFGRATVRRPGRLRRGLLDAMAGLARCSCSPARAGFCAGFLRPRRWRDGGALDAGAAVTLGERVLMPRCRDAAPVRAVMLATLAR